MKHGAVPRWQAECHRPAGFCGHFGAPEGALANALRWGREQGEIVIVNAAASGLGR
jgi:hypothetical protein